MITLRYRTLVAFFAGIALTVVAGFTFRTWRADAAPGDADTTFVPITPCRLIDTRPAPFRVGPHGAFGVDDTKTIMARGTNGDCTIPNEAVGLLLNVTAVSASQRTFLTVWPGGTKPTASSLNPTPGEPPTPNAVTTNLSNAGAFNMFNRFGTVDVIIDVGGYYTRSSLQELSDDVTALEAVNTDLEARLVDLEADNTTLKADVAALKTKTASMSVEKVDGQPTVRFSNVNVQIVDGSGDTSGAVNGKGNLIVGYNENVSDTRTGSHNLIVGPYHSHGSYGGLIAGYNNTISGEYSSVSGGSNNTASGTYSSVSGGSNNTASGTYSSVSGGSSNTANGYSSSVSGGNINTASGSSSSVSGGYLRSATGWDDWVAGGLFQDN